MNQSLKPFALIPLVFSVGILVARPAAAIAPQIENLDTNFNTTGNILGTSDTTANAVAIQPDDKIVAAGSAFFVGGNNDMAVWRYNANGTLDAGFSGSGTATAHFSAGSSRANSVVLQPDGKVVVTGYYVAGATSAYDFALARFNSDGSLDSGFGAGGKVTTDLGGTFEQGDCIALQSDGKLLVSGITKNSSGGYDYALLRYNSDGNLDASFGSNGRVITALGNTLIGKVSLALQADGKIVIASTYKSTGDADFFVARYTADGVLDTTFNPSGSGSPQPGTVTTDLGASVGDGANAVVVQPDGKIVLGGISGSATSSMALVRYNTDGSLDSGFAAGGKWTYNPTSNINGIDALALQPNGKILAAGYANNPSEVALVRVDSAGSVEGSRLDAFSTGDAAYAVAMQPDDKLVVAGSSIGPTTSNVSLVARYTADDGPWDTTPDAFTFTDLTSVEKGSVQTSNMITVAGLGSDVSVPVIVRGGEYAKNGSTTYTSETGWVRNGDTLNVRNTAPSSDNQSTETDLIVGGVVPVNNHALAVGIAYSEIFSSSTPVTSSGGGGLLGPWSLALLLAGWRRRRATITHQ